LERAKEMQDPEEIERAIQRLLLLHGIIFTVGGIPLIYLGDEVGTLNDYDYSKDIRKEGDARWLHRPKYEWESLTELRRDPETPEARIFQGMLKLVQIRQNNMAFNDTQTEFVDTGNEHVFGYFRTHAEQNVLCLANFSEHPQDLSASRLRQLGLRKTFTDIVSGQMIVATERLTMAPLQFAVLLGTL
jgi:amylosucrase